MWWISGAFAGSAAILTAITDPPSWDEIIYRPWYAFVMVFAALHLPLSSVPQILYFSLSLFFHNFSYNVHGQLFCSTSILSQNPIKELDQNLKAVTETNQAFKLCSKEI